MVQLRACTHEDDDAKDGISVPLRQQLCVSAGENPPTLLSNFCFSLSFLEGSTRADLTPGVACLILFPSTDTN